MLGLPDSVTTCLFDLDGVLTDTASIHRTCWKHMFDEYLRARDGDGFAEFTDADYYRYVDGKPRQNGVRDFLASRDISLPDGTPDDPPSTESVAGLGNRKNELVHDEIRTNGVTVYEGSRRYLEAAQDAGLHRIVVSSSANTEMVLDVTGLARFVEGRIDGVTLSEQGIAGKPEPDSFIAGATLVGAEPAECAVFEDAEAGVQAGARGRFGYVVGVNRVDRQHAADLADNGASVVVDDLAELLPGNASTTTDPDGSQGGTSR